MALLDLFPAEAPAGGRAPRPRLLVFALTAALLAAAVASPCAANRRGTSRRHHFGVRSLVLPNSKTVVPYTITVTFKYRIGAAAWKTWPVRVTGPAGQTAVQVRDQIHAAMVAKAAADFPLGAPFTFRTTSVVQASNINRWFGIFVTPTARNRVKDARRNSRPAPRRALTRMLLGAWDDPPPRVDAIIGFAGVPSTGPVTLLVNFDEFVLEDAGGMTAEQITDFFAARLGEAGFAVDCAPLPDQGAIRVCDLPELPVEIEFEDGSAEPVTVKGVALGSDQTDLATRATACGEPVDCLPPGNARFCPGKGSFGAFEGTCADWNFFFNDDLADMTAEIEDGRLRISELAAAVPGAGAPGLAIIRSVASPASYAAELDLAWTQDTDAGDEDPAATLSLHLLLRAAGGTTIAFAGIRDDTLDAAPVSSGFVEGSEWVFGRTVGFAGAATARIVVRRAAADRDRVSVFLDDELLTSGETSRRVDTLEVHALRFEDSGPAFGTVSLDAVVFRSICGADLDGSGDVGFGDLLALLAAWGSCDGCGEDLDCDGRVGFADLLAVLAAWGPCA